MADFPTARHKRLLFQSTHRGMKETDTLLGGFARAHLAELDAAQLDRFEALLEQSDADLFDWITGKAPVPAEFENDVMALLKTYKARL